MTGSGALRGSPLRAEDPSRLGDYALLTRLGEGGMGRVYLARSPAGQLVAVKVIRTDVAKGEEFRRRFRGEVARARQVPPFCTAEVLDADPDHDPPYLVVEYVDGPDLGTVVRERGPLSPANLHGLAIGVATALTAIHGAGVIHRDLKAGNVLLAPGSPKVIDFGIAREVETTARHTSTGELIGTVAYMAPERLEPAGRELTPAADIFAWGAVVAYAGTGRAPFVADSLPALALRILMEPPDLDGLGGGPDPDVLRGLVEQALAKDPAARPTARELLDRLLMAGTDGAGRRTAVPASNVELMRTGSRRAQVDPSQPAVPTAPIGTAAAAGTARAAGTAGAVTAIVPGGAAGGGTGVPPPTGSASSTASLAGSPPSKVGRRRSRTGLALVLTAVLAAGAVTAALTGVLPISLGRAADQDRTVDGTPPPATGPPDHLLAGAELILRDPLAAPRYWTPSADEPSEATCAFAGGLVASSDRGASYRCRGPQDRLTDLAVFVDVTLLHPGSCGSVWFRFTLPAGGYAVRVCEDGYYLVTHGVADSRTVTTLRTFPFDEPVPVGAPVRVGIVADGTSFRFFRDQVEVAAWSDATLAVGYVELGLLQMRDDDPPPYQVRFGDIEIWARGG